MSEVKMLSSGFYFGMFFGSILSGYLADKVLGRRKTVNVSALLTILTTLSFIVANNFR
jgi:dipeptide/tripeptide permease